jgi:hypothetical protein
MYKILQCLDHGTLVLNMETNKEEFLDNIYPEDLNL